MHGLESNYIANLEQQTITALSSLVFFKEDIQSHPSISLLSCTQLLGLECRLLEDRMNIILNNPLQNYMFSIEHDYETTDAPSWRSAVLSLNNSDELGAQLLLGNYDDHYTCVTLDRQMIEGGQIMMNDIFHYYDGYFLMRTSHFDEKFFPTSYFDPYGANIVIDEWYSF